MKSIPFYIVDVFADAPYKGNQLAVFLNASGLSTNQMQQIAQEIGFAESVFILSEDVTEAGVDIRIFTVEYEVPFAGHPTLGSAYVVQQFMSQRQDEWITLNTKIGKIPVSLTYAGNNPNFLFMEQINPSFGPEFSAGEVAAVLGLPDTAIDPNFPIQQVSTGLPFLIIPLKKLEDMKSIKVSLESMQAFLKKEGLHKETREDGLTVGFYCFCPETYSPKNHLNARMLALENGKIIEDAATGSANGCLLGYLLHHQYYPSETSLNLLVEQGYEIGRNASIKINGTRLGPDKLKIKVGGQVQLIAKGEWFTP